MGKYTQDKRPLKVTTALGKDELLLAGFSGVEAVSQPFVFTLELLSENQAVDPATLLRTSATVSLQLPNGAWRHLNGVISRFTQLGQRDDLTFYRAEIVPWLWFLSLSSDCRVFQNLSVLEIAERVFKDQGYSDFQIKCTKSYPSREYCVQFRETHLNFVSRLLEEEGIFYFFQHEDGKHTLILADSGNAIQPCPDQPSVRVALQREGGDEDVVTHLEREHVVESGKITLRDYDPLQPSLRLERSAVGREPEELFDYPGAFTALDEGERYVRIRLEEQEAGKHVVRGAGSCRGLRSGYRVDVKDHYRKDVNQTYQLLEVRHQARGGDYRSWDTAPLDYDNDFVAIPHSVPYRPLRRTPKPTAMGYQLALVVGKSGEEIWTDKHGRVKVQFYWDRQNQKDESSSCWVRVSSTWAGKGWGFVQIPRIGQEVIVEFFDGDPDLPIITGRVYNAELMPPYELPANQTQSGLKTRSSKGGGTADYNELRFEDKKGSEQVLLHAQKDLAVEVENDETQSVEHDRTTTIKHDDTRTVQEGNDAVTVEKGDQTVEIKTGKQTITVQGDQAMTVKQGNQALEIKMGKQTVTIQGDQVTTLNQGNHELTVKMGNQTTNVKMGNLTTKVDLGNVSTKAGLGKCSTEAMQGIELKVGQSSIKIDQMGVTIKGMMVKVEGQIQTQLKGLMTQINGDAMLQAKGAITMIG